MGMAIHNFLLEHAEKKPVSFHMPGHKGDEIYKKYGFGDFLKNIMNCDVTEIPGADNLFQAESTLKEVEDRYADLYDVKKSYLLINGTSGGLIAAVMASVPKSKKLLMARNCHKSVFNALTLAGIQPVYAYCDTIEEYGITGAVSSVEIEAKLKADPDIEAILLPSPNYYGICSDIKSISNLAHKYGKILIVDQAHGAHLKMFSKFEVAGFPLSAEEQGADIVVNSIHKTLASFTQSALLNVVSNRVDIPTLEDKLQAIQSTSPSYILMASLSINEELLRQFGSELMQGWKNNLEYFYKKASGIEGLTLFDRNTSLDWTKINFAFSTLNLPGNIIEDELNSKYNLFIELYTGIYVMCMSGIGNTKKDYETLLSGLTHIKNKYSDDEFKQTSFENSISSSAALTEESHILNPIPVEKEWLHIDKAAGRTCAGSLIPYPPGIPLVCPGEVITKDDIALIKTLRARNEKVIGISDGMNILVGTAK